MPTLPEIEVYLDATPRTGAHGLSCGPFTLFRSDGPWSYYARPSLGQTGPITAADAAELGERCVAVGVPLSIEWIHETTPSLAAAVRTAGLIVSLRPLLALELPLTAEPARADHGDAWILAPDDPRLAEARAVADLGFGDPGVDLGPAGPAERDLLAAGLEPLLLEHLRRRAAAGHSVTAVAADLTGIVSVGVHQPVGDLTEIVGVATLPIARRQGRAAAVTRALVRQARSTGVRAVILTADSDDVARIYEREGFCRVGTSCEAGPPEST